MGKKSEIPGSQPVDWTPENGYPEYVDPNSNYYPRKSPGRINIFKIFACFLIKKWTQDQGYRLDWKCF